MFLVSWYQAVVLFLKGLAWCRHLALIRGSLNLFLSTCPDWVDWLNSQRGLSWYKMFIMQSSNYFCSSRQVWETCASVRVAYLRPAQRPWSSWKTASTSQYKVNLKLKRCRSMPFKQKMQRASRHFQIFLLSFPFYCNFIGLWGLQAAQHFSQNAPKGAPDVG